MYYVISGEPKLMGIGRAVAELLDAIFFKKFGFGKSMDIKRRLKLFSTGEYLAST